MSQFGGYHVVERSYFHSCQNCFHPESVEYITSFMQMRVVAALQG